MFTQWNLFVFLNNVMLIYAIIYVIAYSFKYDY